MADNTECIAKLKKFASKANKYMKDQTERIKADLEFVGGEQFTDDADRKHRGDSRAEFKFNLTKQYCNQIINQYNKNPYGITIEARKQEAVDKAVIAQSIIRGWEAQEDAQDKYGVAIDNQVKCGVGYVVLSNDYTSKEGWDQEVKITPIYSPEMVIYDPLAKAVDGADATEVAFVEHIGHEVAESMCGEDENIDFDYITSPLEGTTWEAPEGSVELITYFRLKKKSTKLILGSDGNNYTPDKKMPRGVKSTKERNVVKTVVSVYKIIGEKVIAETELPLSRLPIIPFFGEIIRRRNKLDRVGIVYFAKDPARLINWTASLTAERIAISPKTTRYVDGKSIIKYKDFWQQANKLNPPYLPYDSKVGDETFNPPTDSNPSVNLSDTSTAQQNYQQLLSGVLGMSENGAVTEQGLNETATSILTRNKSKELANFQYMNNAAKSIKAVGRVLLEMMSIIYDTERMVPVVSEENGKQMVSIDYQQLDIIPDELEVNIEAGPMQATERNEELNGLLALGTMLGPDVALAFADDIVSNTNWKNAKSVAAKLKQMATTKLGLTDPNAPAPAIDPQAQQALDAASQATEQLQTRINEANNYINMLVTEIQNKDKEIQLGREKMAMDYKKAVDVEAMKQQGALNKVQAELVADAELQAQKQNAEVDKAMAEQPQINVIAGITPRYNSVDGLRSRQF
jgi:hypothetical protein